MKQFWKTGLVLLVLIGLGAYMWFVERKRPDADDKPKEKAVTLDKAKAREIVLARAGGEEIRLVRQGDAWRMTAPQDVPADASAVDAILGSLESLDAEEVVTESATDVAQFGLEPPRVAVTVTLEGAGPARLHLGGKTPDEGALYARIPDRPRVFTVAGYLEGSFDKQPFDLRDRDVLHVKRDAVTRLAATGDPGPFTLVRDARGEWAFAAPVSTRAGRWTVDGLLGTLEGLRMEKVVSETPAAGDLKAWGLDPPARTVTVTLADGVTRTLEIGAADADKKRYARVAGVPLVVLIPPALADDLAKGMAEYRAKRLLDVATYEVQAIEVETPAGKRAYQRSSVKDKDGVDSYTWKRTAPDAKDVATSAVQDLLFEVGGVEALEFVDRPQAPAAYGLEAPAVKVTLRHDTEQKPPVWFALGRRDGAVYARRMDDEAVLKLDPAKAEGLIKKLGEL
jgi:hypothetical protein